MMEVYNTLREVIFENEKIQLLGEILEMKEKLALH